MIVDCPKVVVSSGPMLKLREPHVILRHQVRMASKGYFLVIDDFLSGP